MKQDNAKNSFIQTINKSLEDISVGNYAQIPLNDNIPEIFKQISNKINRISEMLEELEEYSLALSRGNLDVIAPNRKNFLAAGIKTIHAQLNHISWQAKQVSMGDYDQVVDFMGEFSHAFNTMTDMLKQRELVSKERQKFLMRLFDKLNLIIVVLNEQDKSILFLNKAALEYKQKYYYDNRGQGIKDLLISTIIKNLPEIDANSVFFESFDQSWYQIECTLTDWQEGKKAIICTLFDITQMKQTEDLLRDAAEKDAFTGVYRREAGTALFYSKMKSKLANGQYVVCYLDVNNLKLINDRYGHSAGDVVIREAAETLKVCLRDNDIIMRVGGDEFVYILMNCDEQEACEINNRIFKRLEKYNQKSGLEFELSVSIGMSQASSDYRELEALIEIADIQMYHSKKKKKNLALALMGA